MIVFKDSFLITTDCCCTFLQYIIERSKHDFNMKATINIVAVNKLLNTCTKFIYIHVQINVYRYSKYMYSKCTLPDIEKCSLRDDHYKKGLDVELGDPGV